MVHSPHQPPPFTDAQVTSVNNFKNYPSTCNIDANSSPAFSLIYVIDKLNRKVGFSVWSLYLHRQLLLGRKKRGFAVGMYVTLLSRSWCMADIVVSMATGVNSIQARQWTNAPDVNYMSAGQLA